MENENPSYFAIIPADVRYDKRLKANEKLMYGEITCLANKLGYCFSTNNYFAELYDVTPQAISGWIKNLEKCGYITCEYLHNGTEIKERRIRIVKDTNSTNNEEGNSTKLEKGINKSLKGYKQKFKDNNTSSNNTSSNNTSAKVNPLILKNNTEWLPTVKEYEEYKTLYPNVDIETQFRKMRGWLNGNPVKRKTRKGIARFVNNWLSKEQDKQQTKVVQTKEQYTDEEYMRSANFVEGVY